MIDGRTVHEDIQDHTFRTVLPIVLEDDEVRSLNRIGFFFQDEREPLKTVEIIYGERYDYHIFSHWNSSPRSALLYHPTFNHTLKLSSGLAYRAPPLELFSINGGNKGLDHEKIITDEAGCSISAFRRLKGELNLFYDELSNLISHVHDYRNRYSTETYGGEIHADMLLTSGLKTFLNCSWQQFHDIARDAPTAGGSPLPRHKINGGIHRTSLWG